MASASRARPSGVSCACWATVASCWADAALSPRLAKRTSLIAWLGARSLLIAYSPSSW